MLGFCLSPSVMVLEYCETPNLFLFPPLYTEFSLLNSEEFICVPYWYLWKVTLCISWTGQFLGNYLLQERINLTHDLNFTNWRQQVGKVDHLYVENMHTVSPYSARESLSSLYLTFKAYIYLYCINTLPFAQLYRRDASGAKQDHINNLL